MINHEQPMKKVKMPEREHPKALEELILSAWESVLGLDFRSHPGFTYQTPFYEIWGNSIAAAAFASEYSNRGFAMSSEDVLSCPSVAETLAVLLLRTKDDTKKAS
jgi:hypothetical protein